MQVIYKFPIISKYFRYCLRLYILACFVLTLCLILYVLFFENLMNERTYNNLELKSSIDKLRYEKHNDGRSLKDKENEEYIKSRKYLNNKRWYTNL